MAPVLFPPAIQPNYSEVPRHAHPVKLFNNQDVVCSIALSDPSRYVYTGSKGHVRIWDAIANEGSYCDRPVGQLKCLEQDQYVRSIKLLPDGCSLVCAGEAKRLLVWDLASPTPRVKTQLTSTAEAAYALGVSPDAKYVFACCSDGNVAVWDLRSQALVKQIQAHSDGVTSIAVSADGTKFWTGSLDSTVNLWDFRQYRQQVQQYHFPSQVFALAFCPLDEWLAVGLGNSKLELLHATKPEKYQLQLHEAGIFSLKFSSTGKWFISTGKDNLVNVWGTPHSFILQYEEPVVLLSSDISRDDQYMVTGSAKTASLYKMIY